MPIGGGGFMRQGWPQMPIGEGIKGLKGLIGWMRGWDPNPFFS
jgi:hypothetical protein